MDRQEAEYWRGYGEGVSSRIRQQAGESVRTHDHLSEKAAGEYGDSKIDAYARGYRDGCREETSCVVLPERNRFDRQRWNGAA